MREKFETAVKLRLESERDLGFFLSGGVDSSLVLAIALRHLPKNKVVKAFSIGTADSPDKMYAGKLVTWLNELSEENGWAKVEWHPINFDLDQAVNSIPEVIHALETWDTTTIRASTPMYLMCRYIRENTNVKVVMSGEGSDELNGSYLYFHYAPNLHEHHEERKRLLSELFYYDNLRVDRTTANFGLEVRVPFLDKDLISYVMSTESLGFDLPLKIEKPLLREAFIGYLPDWILYRQKDAMSDAVGYTWFDHIRNHARQCNSSQVDVKDDGKVENDAAEELRLFNQKIATREFRAGDYVVIQNKNVRYHGKSRTDAAISAISTSGKVWFRHVGPFGAPENIGDFERIGDLPYLPPRYPEEIYFREIFNQYYPNAQNRHILPHIWVPKWVDTKGESSARVLSKHQKMATLLAEETN